MKNRNDPLPDAGFRFARILLIFSLALLPFLACIDYKNDYLLPAIAKTVVFFICLIGFWMSRNDRNHQLVRLGATVSLLLMASVGAAFKLDSYIGLIWVPVLPLLFCFLVGIKKGVIFTSVYFLVYLVSYSAFDNVHGTAPVDLDSWMLTMVAYVFVLVVTVLFQVEVGKDKNQLKNAARYDFLTQVLNRHGFVPRIEDEVARINRYGGELSLIMVDIDDFKSVNDKHGHGVGDVLLAEIAGLLAQHTRASDVVARWGGEEFVILAPNTSLGACAELAEKLRACIESKKFPEVGQVTASFGVTQFRPPATLNSVSKTTQNKISEGDELWTAFISRGDEFLYKAKAEGKNRVAVDYESNEVLAPVVIA